MGLFASAAVLAAAGLVATALFSAGWSARPALAAQGSMTTVETPPARVVEAAPIASAGPDERPLADDTVLLELLSRAVDLRRREDFDRMLDAREAGELIEHATLTDTDFDHRRLGIDTLFIVGDELFAYLFRPENGWGGKGRRVGAADYTPAPRRIHNGLEGGPDAFACANCHSKGGPDGAGTQTQNAFLRGDGQTTTSADQRNAPHVLGLGPVEILAREMTAELQAERDAALAEARKSHARVEKPLLAKGVTFGRIAALEGGGTDTSGVEGVDADLVVKPFGWKGHQATLRQMIEESLQIHQGLLSRRIQLAVKDGTLDRGPYGQGPWYDLDEDGVSLEIDSGMLTTVVGYLAQLEVPVIRPPRDPGLVDLYAAGRIAFEKIGCANCHVPILELKDPTLDAAAGAGPDRAPFVINVARDGDGPKIEPKYAGTSTGYLVRLFSDLKRHDMGPDLASPSPQGSIPAQVFLTRPLWGLAETAPYLHDGRAPTVNEAILLHGGEAAAARDAYRALDDDARAGVRVFLTSLSRQPKLFVP